MQQQHLVHCLPEKMLSPFSIIFVEIMNCAGKSLFIPASENGFAFKVIERNTEPLTLSFSFSIQLLTEKYDKKAVIMLLILISNK